MGEGCKSIQRDANKATRTITTRLAGSIASGIFYERLQIKTSGEARILIARMASHLGSGLFAAKSKILDSGGTRAYIIVFF